MAGKLRPRGARSWRRYNCNLIHRSTNPEEGEVSDDRNPPVMTAKNQSRRNAIIHAAALTLIERGYSDTRIADVAQRANVSTALVFYHFETRENLLLETLKRSESDFREAALVRLGRAKSVKDRLTILIEMACAADDDDTRMQWGLYFELLAQAQRHVEIAEARAFHARAWRDLITHVVREGQINGDIDASVDEREFAVVMAAMLDGMTAQVALNDSEVTESRARELAQKAGFELLGLR
ncbi:AcrR family transcriptional regulator [Mycolicibacterium sp. 624]